MKELLSSSRLRWAGVTRTTRSGTFLESVSDVVLSGELNFEDCQNQKYSKSESLKRWTGATYDC